MRGRSSVAFGCQVFGLLGLLSICLDGFPRVRDQSELPTRAQAEFFETNIRPLLVERCYSCHGKDQQSAGLRLDSRGAMLKGGGTGPAIVPGEPSKSLLVAAIHQAGALKMPLGGKLSVEEIANFENWIEMGAPWPDRTVTDRPLWSLQPVVKPPIPRVKKSGWVKNPIDNFVLSKLEAAHLNPAPSADRRTLIRRVTYDLTGLPPSASEVDAFMADKAPNAYEKVVDRLLASPRYGERWGRHWLDVARYADTKGYVFMEDRNYPSAYVYRDWVIRAINEDLPYNKFIVDQIAADRLPQVISGDDVRPLAALGFLTLGRRFLNSTPDIIDDRIDVTMRGLQGLTVACARCHDHKFDPIPTQDYYSLYAVFKSSVERTEPISDRSIREPWEKYNRQVVALQGEIRNIVLAQVKHLREANQTLEGAKSLSPEVKGVLQAVGIGSVPDPEALRKLLPAFDLAGRDRLQDTEKSLVALQRAAPPTPELAMALEDSSNPADGVIFKRGNAGAPGGPAPRRFLACLTRPGEVREHWTEGSGRLQLAEAIASARNPLTARVFVNRVWQDHFGAGIVRTPSNFGQQGERPTDQKLLDYLAVRFMEDGWSMKNLHRLIVTSATYRQASDATVAVLNADPDNRLWSRMNRRRLDLEETRDTFMDAAGRLDLSQVGGKSVDLWAEPFTGRRAVYGFIERQNLPGIFKTFDFASPDSTSEKRFVTTVPQQALFFMNSSFSVDAAREAAERPEIAASRGDGQLIRRLYRLLFQRMPTPEEVATGLAYLKNSALSPIATPANAWRYGYGESAASGRGVASFVPLTFIDGMYRAGREFPDPSLGFVMLNPRGGHPGRDSAHSVVRRWTAPRAMTIHIKGLVAHRQTQGDGIRAMIASSRAGLLGSWRVHNSSAVAEIKSLTVAKGETIDFIVDPTATDGFDAFSWAPSIEAIDGSVTWDSYADFGPPDPKPLTRLDLYVQALMMTNEYLFVD